MSEHERLMKKLNEVFQELKELKNKVETTNTIPEVLTVETFTEHFGLSPSTQAKYRTQVKDKLPFTKAGKTLYLKNDVLAWLKRNQLNAKT